MLFYDIFEQLCKEMGVTPTQAARDNGISQSVVSMWKKRGSIPNAVTLVQLAEYFNTTPAYLMGNPMAKCPDALGVRIGGKIIAPGGFKSKHGVYAGGGIEADGPVEIGLVVQGELARVVKAVEQMNEEGRSKVADYAEDILPRYRTETASQPAQEPQEGTDTTPPENAPEGPQEPSEEDNTNGN